MENIKVSIIVPVYNVEKYLAGCLDSALAQTLSPIEILCVDDGSTDSSPRILQRYAEKDARITVLRQSNGGLSAARNTGMDAARGEYLYFLDSDDQIAAPDAMEKLYARVAADELDMLFFEARMSYESEDLRRNTPEPPDFYYRRHDYPDILNGQALYTLMDARGEYHPSAWIYLSRREFVNKAELRFPFGLCHEDEVFTLEALSLAQRTACVHLCGYDRLWRAGSIMTDRNRSFRIHGNFFVAESLQAFASERLSGADEAFMRLYSAHARDIARRGVIQYMKLTKTERRAFLDGLKENERAAVLRRLQTERTWWLARSVRMTVKRHSPKRFWALLKKLKSR